MSDGDAGTGESTASTETATTTAETAPATTTGAGSENRSFSQEDVDKIVQQRVAKEQKKFGDYDDLKSKASKLTKLEEEQQTDAEKAQARMADLERKDASSTTAIQEARLENAVLRSATTVGIVDADAAVKLLDHSEIEFDGNGTPTNIDKLLKKLVEERPYLAGNATRKTTFDGGARANAGGGRSMDELIRGT